MAKKRSLIQRVPLGPVFAVMFGAAAVILVAATPQWLFDATVASSGLGQVLGVAQPPLGIKARLLAIFVAFVVVGLVGWLAGSIVDRLLLGPRVSGVMEDDDELDLAGFAQTLPPAGVPRRPIFADRELGAPLMSDEALATAATLAQPVAGFDPTQNDPEHAEPEMAPAQTAPFEPDVAADPVLQTPLVIEEFDVPAIPGEPDTLPGESSIDALIRRLEAGLARRAGPPPPPGGPAAATVAAASPRDWLVRDPNRGDFDEDTTRALGTLRRMAS